MSTFGEIVEPDSRTTWEDWDDINQEQYKYHELKWKKDLESPGQIETLFIFEGRYLSDCIRSQTAGKLIPLNSVPEVNLHLFKAQNSENYLCTIRDYNMILSSEIVELLRQYLIVSEYVIAVQTKALTEYQTSERVVHDCIIRCVNTTKCSEAIKPMDLNFPKLEQPNIVSGVPAGVVSLREHLNQPATAIVCYLENPEEHQIVELQKLMQKLDIPQDIQPTTNSILSSNLYI